jgi:prepilin-type processing-associated H-X9-DG protein
MTRYTGDPMGNQTPLFTGDLPSPSRTVALTEKGSHPPGNSGDSAAESIYQSKGATYAAGGVEVKDFHQNGKNLLYVDGHVKFAAKGSGPYKDYFNYTGQGCPLGGAGVHSAYEDHAQGHCEFWPDWPYE